MQAWVLSLDPQYPHKQKHWVTLTLSVVTALGMLRFVDQRGWQARKVNEKGVPALPRNLVLENKEENDNGRLSSSSFCM